MSKTAAKRKFLPSASIPKAPANLQNILPPAILPLLPSQLPLQASDHHHNTRQKKRTKKHEESVRYPGDVETPESPSLPSNGYWLKLQPQPPRNPYVNVYFSVKLFLMERLQGNKKEHIKVGHTVPIYVELLYDNNELVGDQHMLELHPNSDCQIRGSGVVDLQFRLKELSMNHENRKFVVRFSCPHDQLLGAIEPVQSAPMLSIRHCLRIMEHLPEIWYKDEGGREKCIEINCLLVNETGEPVYNRSVPLAVSLVYENEHQDVKNQSILKVNNGITPKIDLNGAVHLRLRIEEVSKNHQKQAFCVKVAPDTDFSPANCDIAPIISSSVRVLSKRNRRRKAASSSFTVDDAPGRKYQQNRFSSTPVSRGHMPPAMKMRKTLPQAIGSRNSTPAECVYAWCNFVFHGLKELQWCHSGYEINDDGSIDISRPLFRCPSCWVYKDMIKNASHRPGCMIHLAVSSFSDTVGKKITSLSKHRKVAIPTATVLRRSSSRPTPPSPSAVKFPALSPGGGAFSVLASSSSRGRGASRPLLTPPVVKNGNVESPNSILESPMPTIGEISTRAIPMVNNGRQQSISLLAPTFNRQISRDFSREQSHQFPPPPPFGRAPSLELNLPSMMWQTSQPMFLDHHGSPGLLAPGTTPNANANTNTNTNGSGRRNGGRSPSTPLPSSEEMQIVAILGVLKKHGLPAYNSLDKCVGFYGYGSGRGPSTLRFRKFPIDGMNENSVEVKVIDKEYLKCKNSSNPSERGILITRAEHFSLEKMKEKAILRHLELVARQAKGTPLPRRT